MIGNSSRGFSTFPSYDTLQGGYRTNGDRCASSGEVNSSGGMSQRTRPAHLLSPLHCAIFGILEVGSEESQ